MINKPLICKPEVQWQEGNQRSDEGISGTENGKKLIFSRDKNMARYVVFKTHIVNEFYGIMYFYLTKN